MALALVLGLAAAGLTSCGGGSSEKLIPPENAAALQAALDQVGDQAAEHNCDTATAATDQVLQLIDDLPNTVDPRLVRDLKQGTIRLKGLTSDTSTCAAETTTTPTVTTQTQTQTVTTPPQTQTQTQTTPPPPDGGGTGGTDGTGGTGGTGGTP
jgi:hypothetical protein